MVHSNISLYFFSFLLKTTYLQLLITSLTMVSSGITKVNSLYKVYQKVDWKRTPYDEYALRGITIDIKPQSVYTLIGITSSLNLLFTSFLMYAFIGTSGSGKSTLLKMLSRMEKPTSGNITHTAGESLYLNPLYYLSYPPLLSLKDIKNSLTFEQKEIFMNAFDRFHIPENQPAQVLFVSYFYYIFYFVYILNSFVNWFVQCICYIIFSHFLKVKDECLKLYWHYQNWKNAKIVFCV